MRLPQAQELPNSNGNKHGFEKKTDAVTTQQGVCRTKASYFSSYNAYFPASKIYCGEKMAVEVRLNHGRP